MTYQLREMSKEELEWFMRFYFFSTDKIINKFYEDIVENKGAWGVKVIEKRLLANNISCDKATALFIYIAENGITGKCAKHVDCLSYELFKQNKSSINFEQYINNVFPKGIPDTNSILIN